MSNRINAINGTEKMSLAKMPRRQNAVVMEPESEKADLSKLARAFDYITNKAIEEAKLEANVLIKTAEQKTADLIKAKENEGILFARIQHYLEQQNADLKAEVALLAQQIADHRAHKAQSDSSHEIDLTIQRGLLRDMEMQLSKTAGLLAQAHKQIADMKEMAVKSPPVQAVAPRPVRPYPEYRFRPIKNDMDDIVEIVATPIEGRMQ